METKLLTDRAASVVPSERPDLQRRPDGRMGFSLVEVTLALGLVVFAGVTILGLLPTGLRVMREAMNQTVEAQILRSIAGQAIVERFDQLAEGGPFFFDNEGLAAAADGDVVYTVTVSRHAPDYPGSGDATARLDESLAKLRIEILEQRGGPESGRTTTHALHVANYGK